MYEVVNQYIFLLTRSYQKHRTRSTSVWGVLRQSCLTSALSTTLCYSKHPRPISRHVTPIGRTGGLFIADRSRQIRGAASSIDRSRLLIRAVSGQLPPLAGFPERGRKAQQQGRGSARHRPTDHRVAPLLDLPIQEQPQQGKTKGDVKRKINSIPCKCVCSISAAVVSIGTVLLIPSWLAKHMRGGAWTFFTEWSQKKKRKNPLFLYLSWVFSRT